MCLLPYCHAQARICARAENERASEREREREREYDFRARARARESERESDLNLKFTTFRLPQVSYADSLKISLALKKSLVDKGLLDITQNDMEEALFSIMRAHGYGEDYVARYLRHNN